MTSVTAKLAEHREDLIRLLSFVDDPRALAEAGALTGTEQKWLRVIEADLAFGDAALLELFSADQVERARQAFALMS